MTEQQVCLRMTERLEAAKATGRTKDKYLRLYAEFDNYRRRSAKNGTDQTAGKEVITALTDVLTIATEQKRKYKEACSRKTPCRKEYY